MLIPGSILRPDSWNLQCQIMENVENVKAIRFVANDQDCLPLYEDVQGIMKTRGCECYFHRYWEYNSWYWHSTQAHLCNSRYNSWVEILRTSYAEARQLFDKIIAEHWVEYFSEDTTSYFMDVVLCDYRSHRTYLPQSGEWV